MAFPCSAQSSRGHVWVEARGERMEEGGVCSTRAKISPDNHLYLQTPEQARGLCAAALVPNLALAVLQSCHTPCE